METKYESPVAVPPGNTLYEILKERGMKQTQLARAMKRPIKLINEIIKSKARMTAETALGFEEVLGIEAQFWLNLQSAFELDMARGKKLLYSL